MGDEVDRVPSLWAGEVRNEVANSKLWNDTTAVALLLELSSLRDSRLLVWPVGIADDATNALEGDSTLV